MTKKKFGSKPFLFPMPVVIIGSQVEGKPNFLTASYIGIVQHDPAMLAVALGKKHVTTEGIKENRTFSVNIPSDDMAKIADYIGVTSGKIIDKADLFEVFYGKLETAPMIEFAPVNLECKLVQSIDLGSPNEIFIAEVIETYVEPSVITHNIPDIEKINPIIYAVIENKYFKLGKYIQNAWTGIDENE